MSTGTSVKARLPADLDAFVSRRVDSGLSSSLDEAVAQGLALLRERDARDRQVLEGAGDEIQQGLASLDAGKGLDGEEAFSRLEERLG